LKLTYKALFKPNKILNDKNNNNNNKIIKKTMIKVEVKKNNKKKSEKCQAVGLAAQGLNFFFLQDKGKT